MTTKLNLTIEEDTAARIKQYAAKRKTSVSKIAEEYFSSLIRKEAKHRSGKKSFVEKYGGCINDISIVDIDKAREEYLKEKYGV